MSESTDVCCPPFEPGPWENQEIVWNEKRFIKDRVWCLFYIPMNFGAVMKRNLPKLIEADVACDPGLVLGECLSPWRMDVYIDVAKEVPDANNVVLSGTYLSKVFEGPYRDMGKWMREMQSYVAGKGEKPKRFLTYYTTCPKCAKKFGKNYVVILAEV